MRRLSSLVQVRLQKFLAEAGVASRRASERLIVNGLVEVNGQVVKELGTKVDPLHDAVKVEGRLVKSRPVFRSRIMRRYCAVDAAITITPIRTSAVPVQRENPEERTGTFDAADPISRKNSPKRATTNPNPIKARPVRIHANNVRSAAKIIRGSCVGSVICGLYVCDQSTIEYPVRRASCGVCSLAWSPGRPTYGGSSSWDTSL